MAIFINIEPGDQRLATGLRVRVEEDGERVWMGGKWLDLGPDHAVAWIERGYRFVRPDGRSLRLGQFPAWVCRSAKGSPLAVMFNVAQFRGGLLEAR